LQPFRCVASLTRFLVPVTAIWVARTVIFAVQAALPQALAVLERAIALKAPSGCIRPFVDEGERMRSWTNTASAYVEPVTAATQGIRVDAKLSSTQLVTR
jgi:hypothetical protein